MSGLSLYTIGALRARAERDAQPLMQKLLAARKAGRSVEQMHEVMVEAQTQNVERFFAEEGITNADVALRCARFYAKESERALSGLMNIFTALTAKESTAL